MKLHEYQYEFKDLNSIVASKLHISGSAVERDYYIRNQLQEDVAEDQITLKEYMDPFTGSKERKA